MPDDQGASTPRRADPRPVQTRELVLQAAQKIILAQGHAAATPTRLAEMTGVARSTIYRHWPDPACLIADALDTGRQDVPLASTSDLRDDLCAYLVELSELLESPAGAFIIAQAEIAERDEGVAETLVGTVRTRTERIHALINDPRADLDAQLLGPLFMQRFFVREPITNELICSVVDACLGARLDT